MLFAHFIIAHHLFTKLSLIVKLYSNLNNHQIQARRLQEDCYHREALKMHQAKPITTGSVKRGFCQTLLGALTHSLWLAHFLLQGAAAGACWGKALHRASTEIQQWHPPIRGCVRSTVVSVMSSGSQMITCTDAHNFHWTFSHFFE